MRKKILAVIMAATFTAGLTACGSGTSADEAETVQSDEADVIRLTTNDLQDGTFYIMHENGTYDQLYIGNTTFSGERNSSYADPDYTRVAWFKEDFGRIPTLDARSGDKLVYYTTGEFDEMFSFERFFDLGYSVGLQGLSRTSTGRIQIPVSESSSYPGSDCDQILKYDSDYVILDKIDDQDVFTSAQAEAADKELYGAELSEDITVDSLISDYGTIKGLDYNTTHRFYIHAGTPLASGDNGSNGLDFTADVRIMGSAEGAATYQYAFDSENNVVKINIPSFFNLGYYTVDNSGMFRYIPSNISGNVSTDNYEAFNEPNNIPEYSSDGDTTDTTETAAKSDKYDSFSITSDQTGSRILVTAQMTKSDGTAADVSDILAYVSTPIGDRYPMTASGSKFTVVMPVETAGDYTIVYRNMDDDTVAEASVQIIE